MKKLILFIVLSILLINLLVIATDNLDYGKIACYPFNYGFNDTIQNFTSVYDLGGGDFQSGISSHSKIGAGSYFSDYEDDFINTTQVFLTNNNWTISMWVQTEDFSNDRALFSQYNLSADGRFFVLSEDNDQDNRTSISKTGSYFLIGPRINDNTWNHLTLRKENTNYSFYINGVYNNSAVSSGNILQTPTILAYVFGIGYQFNGYMDEVKIWNRSLNTSEITSDFNSTVGVACPDEYREPVNITIIPPYLIGCYPMDYDYNDIVNDVVSKYDLSGGYGLSGISSTAKLGTGSYFSDYGNDYINTTVVYLTNGSWTMSSWVNTDNYVTDRGYLGQYYTGLTGRFYIVIDRNNTGNYTAINKDGSFILNGPKVVDNTWKHLVVRKELTNYSFYINGVYNSSVVSAGDVLQVPTILAYIFGVGYQFNGYMDEVKFWNGSLNETTILEDYNSGAGVSCQQLIDEGETDNTFYTTKSGNDANSCLLINESCLTVQAALNKMGSGDTLKIGNGTYNEQLTYSYHSFSNNITIEPYYNDEYNLTSVLTSTLTWTNMSSLCEGCWRALVTTGADSASPTVYYPNNTKFFSWGTPCKTTLWSRFATSPYPENSCYNSSTNPDQLFVKFNDTSKDPNTMNLKISTHNTFTISYNTPYNDAYIIIRGARFPYGKVPINLVQQAYVVIDNIKAYGYTYGIYANGRGVSNINRSIVINSYFDGKQNPVWYQQDMKDSGGSGEETTAIYMTNFTGRAFVDHNNITYSHGAITLASLLPTQFAGSEVSYNIMTFGRGSQLEIENYCYMSIWHDNIARNNSFSGISWGPANSSASSVPCEFYNNQIITMDAERRDKDTLANPTYAIKASTGSPGMCGVNWNIHHNTFIAKYRALDGISDNSFCTDMNLTNNIFYADEEYILFRTGSSALAKNNMYDYNLYYSPAGGYNPYTRYGNDTNTTQYASLAAILLADPTGGRWDQNSVESDPLFVHLDINDVRPSINSPACSMSYTGDYVGALECASDQVPVVSLTITGDTYNNTNTIWTPSLISSDVEGTVYNTSWYNCTRSGTERKVIGIWDFNINETDSNFQDLSGNNNNLTCTNCSIFNASSSVDESGSYIFDGSNDYLQVSNSASGVFNFSSVSNYSICVWFKTNSLSRQALIDKSIASSTNGGWGFELQNNITQFTHYDGSAPSPMLVGTSKVTNNLWHFACVSWTSDNTVRNLFVDGIIEDSSSSQTNAGIGSAYDVRIGVHGGLTTTDNFNGSIDNVRVYNYVLSPQQISEEYNATISRYPARLVPDETLYADSCTVNAIVSDGLVYSEKVSQSFYINKTSSIVQQYLNIKRNWWFE